MDTTATGTTITDMEIITYMAGGPDGAWQPQPRITTTDMAISGMATDTVGVPGGASLLRHRVTIMGTAPIMGTETIVATEITPDQEPICDRAPVSPPLRPATTIMDSEPYPGIRITRAPLRHRKYLWQQL